MLVAGFVLSLSFFHTTQVGVLQDDVDYILLADALAHGEPYGLNYAPNTTDSTQFPFGFPLLLAPIALLFPSSLDALKTLSLVAVLVNASIIFWAWPWFSRRSQWWGLAVSGLYLFSPEVLRLSRQVMAEPVFTTACLLAILLTERAARKRPIGWWGGWLSLTLVAAVAIRTIGITLVVACFAYLLLVHGFQFWKRLVPIVGQMVLLLVAVVALTSIETQDVVPSEYADAYLSMVGLSSDDLRFPGEFKPAESQSAAIDDGDREPEVIETPVLRRLVGVGEEIGLTVPADQRLIELVENGEMHIEEHIRLAVLPLGGGSSEQRLFGAIGVPHGSALLGVLVSALVAFGAVLWYRSGMSAFFMFFVFYLSALFAWLWRDIRFLHPILPQMFFALLLGVEGISRIVTVKYTKFVGVRRLYHMAVPTVVIILIIGSLIKGVAPEQSTNYKGDLPARTSWVKSNTKRNAIILSEMPALDYMYSKRKTVPYPLVPVSEEHLLAYMADRKIDYILIAPDTVWQEDYRAEYSKTGKALLKQIEELERTSVITLVYASEVTMIRVYRFQPG